MGSAIVLRSFARSVAEFPKEFRRLPMLLPPDIGDVGNPDKLWMVCEDWRTPAIDGMQVCVRAPVSLVGGGRFGFFTDGISVPALAWSLFRLQPFSIPELCGALGHDMAYSAELVKQKVSDDWLREWERMAGVPEKRRDIIYGVVRTFGGFVWKKHTEQSVAWARTLCQLVKEGSEPVWGPLPDVLVEKTSSGTSG